MLAVNVLRAVPAATGHNPQVTDRHSGSIEIIPPNTAGHTAATATAHHDRAEWHIEARRVGSDWNGILALHADFIRAWCKTGPEAQQ